MPVKDGIEFQIYGMKEALEKIEGLPKAIRGKGARFAGQKAANLIRDAARKNAERLNDPKTSEEIAKNIVVRFSGRHLKKTGDLLFRIGVMGGARGYARASGEFQGKGKSNPGGDTYYWRYLEFGTINHRAQPFMRPAMQENILEAINEFSSQLDKWIGRNIKKVKKNGI